MLHVGASLTLGNSAGWTPIHRACFNGHLEVVDYILDQANELRAKQEVGRANEKDPVLFSLPEDGDYIRPFK